MDLSADLYRLLKNYDPEITSIIIRCKSSGGVSKTNVSFQVSSHHNNYTAVTDVISARSTMKQLSDLMVTNYPEFERTAKRTITESAWAAIVEHILVKRKEPSLIYEALNEGSPWTSFFKCVLPHKVSIVKDDSETPLQIGRGRPKNKYEYVVKIDSQIVEFNKIHLTLYIYFLLNRGRSFSVSDLENNSDIVKLYNRLNYQEKKEIRNYNKKNIPKRIEDISKILSDVIKDKDIVTWYAINTDKETYCLSLPKKCIEYPEELEEFIIK